MNLFLKIFLWFLAAIGLMIGVVVFLSWTVQTEPVVSRWRVSVTNQTTIWAETAAQIYGAEGEPGLIKFLNRIRRPENISEVDLIGANGKAWMAEGVNPDDYRDLVARALASDKVEIETQPETALSARRVEFPGGEQYVLVVRWEKPRFTPFFGESPLRYLRYATVFLTAVLLCWILARYLSSPISKIREATQRLAVGDLSARVGDGLGRRRDELASLARDFDVMAERIESLLLSQKRLTRDVSHELRSPLARINVALEIAKQKANPEVQPVLSRVELEAERLNDMISQLLTLSRLEAGSENVTMQRINLRQLIEQVTADAEFEAEAKNRAVKMTSVEECFVMGSERLLRSAIENVLRNAVRYTKMGTTVEVSLRNGGGKASVVIRDYGDGVPQSELKNLFRPFYRVSESRDRGSGGTGLGLAIAEQAIRLHRGTIEARNEPAGLAVEIKLNCTN
ncbi:MAG: two-component sensor histidine kinase [Blastocatellia bacterium]